MIFSSDITCSISCIMCGLQLICSVTIAGVSHLKKKIPMWFLTLCCMCLFCQPIRTGFGCNENIMRYHVTAYISIFQRPVDFKMRAEWRSYRFRIDCKPFSLVCAEWPNIFLYTTWWFLCRLLYYHFCFIYVIYILWSW